MEIFILVSGISIETATRRKGVCLHVHCTYTDIAQGAWAPAVNRVIVMEEHRIDRVYSGDFRLYS